MRRSHIRSSGLGLATVVQLVKEGAFVAVLDLSEPSEDLVNNTNIKYWKTDVTKVNEIEKAVEEAAAWANETGKPLAGAICSAGVGVASKVCPFVDINVPHMNELEDDQFT
jgi:3-hydroxyacyl-CoA dehydrogenase/3-hydroxy-2-methylbutyryl-CoA dehydrogenase